MAIQQYLSGGSGGTQTFPTAANAAKLFILGVDEGQWVAPIVKHIFPGVAGARHLVDNRKERQITVDVQLYDYSTEAALNTDHALIESYTNTLLGDLSLDGTTYLRCTFAGVVPISRRQYDGSGAHGWTRKLRLIWFQRAYA